MEDEVSTYQVSTALTLCDPTWNYDTNKGKQLESDPASLHPKLPKRDDMSARKMKENQLLPQPEEPWKIKKLGASDLEKYASLLLPKKWIIDNVRPYLGDKLFERVQSGMGLRVRVHDCDTNTMHYVNFTCWGRGRYVLNGQWWPEFVLRRGFNEKDQIGLYWDEAEGMFMFSLLERANPIGNFVLIG